MFSLLGRPTTKGVRRLATAATEASSSLSGTTSLPWLPEPIRLNIEPLKFQLLSRSSISELFSNRARHIDSSGYLAAATVFPMRANNYVVDDLINWTNVPEDPMFLLTFPQPDMLSKDDLHCLKSALFDGSSKVTQRELAYVQCLYVISITLTFNHTYSESIRRNMNPHPGNQKEENVPSLHGKTLEGMQHKYRETCLIFPTEGQYCHSYCTYCFRWFCQYSLSDLSDLILIPQGPVYSCRLKSAIPIERCCPNCSLPQGQPGHQRRLDHWR